ISNSYKYAFPDKQKGKIDVKVYKEDDMIHFIVKDNGVGLPHDFDERRTSSLGFTIIDTLIQQLEANLEIESEEGTCLHFYYNI
ncbi:MAG: sensor histidine kinase, partial [Balneolaceae bacterium]